MDINKLIDIGFTETQARVYILLFKKQGLRAGEISKELSLDRSFIYNVLDSLIKKGLVYYSLNKNKRHFYPENPSKILDELDERKTKIRKVLDELTKIKGTEMIHPGLEVYEGKNGLRKYLSEIIDSKEFFTLGGGGNLNIFNILKYEYPHYFDSLKKAKLTGKIICSLENKSFWKKNLDKTSIQVRSLSGAGKENSITILKDKLIFSLEQETPHLIIINNSDHVHSLKHYFSYLWELAR